MSGRLQGRVALVTGAGRLRGIGRATALRLAAEGAAVVVSAPARDPASFPEEEKARGWTGAASVAEEIRQGGGRALAVECDVTDTAQVDAMIARARAELGAPDAVVNNAGTAGGAGGAPLLDIDESLWRRTIDINLNGVFNVCRAAGRAMRDDDKPGAIVNLSSLAGRMGMANYGGYCASKFGVIGRPACNADSWMTSAPVSVGRMIWPTFHAVNSSIHWMSYGSSMPASDAVMCWTPWRG